MASVLAILSKSFFERELRVDGRIAGPGDVVAVDRYLSKHKRLEPLADGGSLFLATVRPPDERLLLVAELERPSFCGDRWQAQAPNARPVVDVTHLREVLRFAGGEGIKARPGRLAMSLQTPRVLSDDDVTALRGGGAASAPASKKRVKPRAKQPVKPEQSEKTEKAGIQQAPETMASQLKEAAAALERDPGQAFSLLRRCWEATRWPRLAALIERLGARHETTEVVVALRQAAGVAGMRQKVPQADWLAAEEAARPHERGALAATLTLGTIKEVGERIERIESWEPDPRAAAALIEIVARVPWVSSGSRTTWTRVYRALGALPDPRVLGVAASFDSSVLPTGWQGARDFFDKKLFALASEVRDAVPGRSPGGEEVELLDALEKRLPAAGGARAAGDVEGQLARVLEQPDDDDGFAVLADLLQERGDVRGELIQLQLIERGAKLDKEQRARKKQILKESADQLLGPLHPLVLKRGLTFERGFATSCVLKEKLDARDVEAAMGHPLLGALREIEGPLSFVLQPALGNLRLIALPPGEELSELAGSSRELPIEALACYLRSPEEAALVGRLKSIPRVETLFAICPSVATARALLSTPLGQRLRRLCIDSRPMWTRESCSVEDFPALYPAAAASTTRLERLELRWDHFYTGSFIGRPPPTAEIVARREGGAWHEERLR